MENTSSLTREMIKKRLTHLGYFVWFLLAFFNALLYYFTPSPWQKTLVLPVLAYIIILVLINPFLVYYYAKNGINRFLGLSLATPLAGILTIIAILSQIDIPSPAVLPPRIFTSVNLISLALLLVLQFASSWTVQQKLKEETPPLL